MQNYISMVSCLKGPTCHASAWQIGPFWQDTLDMTVLKCAHRVLHLKFIQTARLIRDKKMSVCVVCNIPIAKSREPISICPDRFWLASPYFLSEVELYIRYDRHITQETPFQQNMIILNIRAFRWRYYKNLVNIFQIWPSGILLHQLVLCSTTHPLIK